MFLFVVVELKPLGNTHLATQTEPEKYLSVNSSYLCNSKQVTLNIMLGLRKLERNRHLG